MQRLLVLVLTSIGLLSLSFGQSAPAPQEGDFVLKSFLFKSGETIPEVRMHYRTFGTPTKDTNGRVNNAVLILHGTSGTGKQFLAPQFTSVLLGPGQLLDTNKYFIIVPDNLGHGASTKPSDGLHARFPHYNYDDMVLAQHELVLHGLHVDHLRLILGTSMGCMHAWVWGESYPDFMDALMPLACLPTAITGRNRIWRKMLIDGIRNDPEWKNGDYATPPREGLQIAADLFVIATGAPLRMQSEGDTREKADALEETSIKGRLNGFPDANDLLYAVDASRDYDPSPRLAEIRARVMFVNFADDFINPPELGIAEREIKKVKNGKFVLVPASAETHGHGTHTWAVFWQQYLKELLEESR